MAGFLAWFENIGKLTVWDSLKSHKIRWLFQMVVLSQGLCYGCTVCHVPVKPIVNSNGFVLSDIYHDGCCYDKKKGLDNGPQKTQLKRDLVSPRGHACNQAFSMLFQLGD
jgi:hypothetical protein